MTMTILQYVYKITEIVKVTDGDTYWLRVDVGFRQNILINVRLYGYDCPETHHGSDFEKTQAAEAGRLASGFLHNNNHDDDVTLWIRTEKDPDSFGRWLGEIWYEDGPDLGETLHDKELATVWPTRWRDVYDVP